MSKEKEQKTFKKEQKQRQQKETELYNDKIEKLALEQKRAIKYHKMYSGATCWKTIQEVDTCLAALK